MKIHSTTFLLITLLLSTAFSSAEVFLPYHRAHVPRGGGRVVRTPPGASSSRGLTGAVASRVVHESVQEVKKQLDWTSWGFRDAIFGGLAVVAAATSTTAIMVEATLIVTIVGVLCIGLGVSSAFLQKRLTEFETMRELTNQMKEQVNTLSMANQQLKNESSKLDENTRKLQLAESSLAQISETQGVSLDKLVEQVQQYKQIQAEVRKDLTSKIQQTLLSVVMASDIDMDYIIDPEEVDVLIMRMKALPSIEFNEAGFRTAIQQGDGSIMAFLNAHLRDDAVIAKEKIFVF